jgi:transcriptional regulator with XRE-family HTH domain
VPALTNPNSRLRDTITSAGCTYEALAKDVRRIAAENGDLLQTNKSAISHWANGTRAPSGQAGQYLAEALSRRLGRVITQTEIGMQPAETEPPSDVDPVTVVTHLGRADVERRRYLAIAAFTTASVAMPLLHDHESTSRMLRFRAARSLVGGEDIDVVRQITAAFSAADERLGGGHKASEGTWPTRQPRCSAASSLPKPYAKPPLAPLPSSPISPAGSTTTLATKAPPSAITRSATSSHVKPTPTGTRPG